MLSNLFKRGWRSLTMLAVLWMALGATHGYAQQALMAQIAAVNSDRILRESLPAKAAQVKLEQEFAKRGRDLQKIKQRLKTMSDDLDKRGATLSATELKKAQQTISQLDLDYQRRQREFREDLNRRRNEELVMVLEKANKAIKQIAERNHYDLILQEAVYVNPRIDITDQVLKVLAAPDSEGKS